MTKEEMDCRISCPYDAMGDYAGLFSQQEKKKPDENQKEDTG